MLKELKRIIDEAFRAGLTEGLGVRRKKADGSDTDPGTTKRRKRTRAIASPEEQAARATLRRVSFN